MTLVKQIGLVAIALSLSALLGCGSNKPSAMDRLRQQVGASAATPSNELRTASQLWQTTYHDRLQQILDQMNKMINDNVRSVGADTWARILGDTPADIQQRFGNSNNPTIKAFLKDFAGAMQDAGRFTNEIGAGKVGNARNERDNYAAKINKMDALLK